MRSARAMLPAGGQLSHRLTRRLPALRICACLPACLQCTQCSKWRIVSHHAAQEIEEDTEWTCSMLR